MTKHYEPEELVGYAFLPDEHASITAHLAGCEECTRRVHALRHALERHATGPRLPEKPETFWKRQELGVMREIEKRRRNSTFGAGRLSAAAAVVFIVAAFWVGRGSVATNPLTATQVTATVAAATNPSSTASQENGLTTSQITTDPWESEQLQEFQNVVDWETWVEDDGKKRGTI